MDIPLLFSTWLSVTFCYSKQSFVWPDSISSSKFQYTVHVTHSFHFLIKHVNETSGSQGICTYPRCTLLWLQASLILQVKSLSKDAMAPILVNLSPYQLVIPLCIVISLLQILLLSKKLIFFRVSVTMTFFKSKSIILQEEFALKWIIGFVN